MTEMMMMRNVSLFFLNADIRQTAKNTQEINI